MTQDTIWDALSGPACIVLVGSFLAAWANLWFRAQRKKRTRETLVFLGVSISIVGAFWAAFQQTAHERQIAEANSTLQAQVTGGDSYCYVKAGPQDMNPDTFWVLSVWQAGSHPCYDVTIQVKDIETFNKTANLPSTKSLLDLKAALPLVKVGTVLPDVVPIFMQLNLQDYEERRFVFLMAFRNGWASQKLALRKIQNQWKKASHLTVHHYSGKPAKEIEEVDPDFPRLPSGEISW